jgi:hypothetical protein
MKPKINLEHPLVKKATEQYFQRVREAMEAPQKVESSVVPMYAILKSKGHQKPKTKPEQIGSGVLVNIKDQYFIFGATHVFLELRNFQVLTGCGDNTPIIALAGDRFSTGKPGTEYKDTFDASVYHIHSDVPAPLKNIALTFDDFDFSGSKYGDNIYMACGFRHKKSNTSGSRIKSKRECFPSAELDIHAYKDSNIDARSHIALHYENQILIDGKWQVSPTPRGISGGAIIKIEGSDLFNTSEPKKNLRQLLSAITIEQHREKHGKPGVLIGTRINVHLGLIHQNMPDLLRDLWQIANSVK